MDTSVAFVTGASRGIGKAIAVALAEGGFDVAIAARTVHDGEAREHSPTVARSDTRPLPGSLAETAARIEAIGRRALPVPCDLLDRASLGAAVATVLERWGHIDVLVNNARYIGPGHQDRFVDTPIELLERHLDANVLAPLVLCELVLPGMRARGGGTIVNITSSAAYSDPAAPAGAGGYGMGYGISKGALHRVAGFLDVELRDEGIRAFNLNPGFVATERIRMDLPVGYSADLGAPAEVVGAVTRWLTTAAADEHRGGTVQAQPLCDELGLVPGWHMSPDTPQ
jgi:NAD(P)-dependent dehydrogenase (short-subunit alcohol dehydrogenase family)